MSTVAAPTEYIELLADLRLPDQADARLQELMDRNNEGRLTENERAELASLVEVSEELSVVRAKALHLLGRAPQ